MKSYSSKFLPLMIGVIIAIFSLVEANATPQPNVPDSWLPFLDNPCTEATDSTGSIYDRGEWEPT